ncbi:MAG: MFS transporter [Candidatus Omnitrophica bacterium]|nr:MFS transporter [Candidatus Omnitrophota bacterium]
MKQNRLAVASWCMYDFANSPFTTLVVTFIFSPFFLTAIVGDDVRGTELWSRAITITAISVAFLSPILGAIADRGGCRKLFLLFWTGLAIFGTAKLFWVLPGDFDDSGAMIRSGQIGMAIFWVVVANIAYEMGCVFYNAFLPDIASSDRIGRISGYGWAAGYLGGLLALTVALFGFVFPERPWFGVSKEAYEHIRATNLLVAVWFAVFSIPIFLWVQENRMNCVQGRGNVLRSSFRQLAGTFHEIKRYRQIIKLLLARLFYNDGLITIFTFSGIYATGTFKFTTTEILVLAIALNIAAGLGAFAMGFLDDVIGGKRTIQISVVGLAVAAALAMIAPGKSWIWIAGILAGIFSGPNQSASRSLMARFVPPQKENEFFGFFAFSGKATAFFGPFLFGVLTAWFQTQRAGIFIVVVFFVIGGVILHFVDEEDGFRLAKLDRSISQ